MGIEESQAQTSLGAIRSHETAAKERKAGREGTQIRRGEGGQGGVKQGKTAKRAKCRELSDAGEQDEATHAQTRPVEARPPPKLRLTGDSQPQILTSRSLSASFIPVVCWDEDRQRLSVVSARGGTVQVRTRTVMDHCTPDELHCPFSFTSSVLLLSLPSLFLPVTRL